MLADCILLQAYLLPHMRYIIEFCKQSKISIKTVFFPLTSGEIVPG